MRSSRRRKAYTNLSDRNHACQAMDPTPSTIQKALEEMAQCLRDRNERYLDYLKDSGDSLDMRSKLLATILDCAADGMIVLDEQLTIVLANAAAARYAGWQLEDVTREELRKNYRFFWDEGKTRVSPDEEPIVVAIREKKPHEMIAYTVSPHISAPGRWVRAHAAPLMNENNEVIGGVTVFNDITERLKLQHQRDSLAALIVHDIKNHLAAEQMFFDILPQAEQLETESLQIVADLRAASRKFMVIAETLLEMFRANFLADSKGEKIAIVPLVERAVSMSELDATKRNVRVIADCSPNCPSILGLSKVICHVIHNVIQNAVEASPENSEVFVSAYFDSECVFVKVTDTGKGMTMEEVSKLFSPLRAAGVEQKTGHSSGFGLYLSHMLVEGQGGTIICASEPGKGTTITTMFPIAR